MYERRTPAVPARPPAPLGTTAAVRRPNDIRVGDFVYRDAMYLRIKDLRSAATAGQRVLIFDGHAPWVLKAPTTTYRPNELL
ncbi:hypothetical protein ACFWBX_20315 [Streptomyces sp. NPDC059991]|uniref:hypothetical protein n=1 Tax=Streptomyces sp. NPDC059991 TaxID=3347028 RepID=UPI00368F35D1